MGQSTLEYIRDHMEEIKLDVDQEFRFHCTRCGQCCYNRDDILVNPFDVYRISKELNISTEEFAMQYCDAYVGQHSRIPLFRVIPKWPTGQCGLLKNSNCSVHKVKPTVCAMFPVGRMLSINAEDVGKKKHTTDDIGFIKIEPGCGDESETHTVREWFDSFGIPIKDEFFVEWHDQISVLSDMLRKVEKHLSHIDWIKLIARIANRLYMEYDLTKEFMPQFRENTQMAIGYVLVETFRTGANHVGGK